MGEGKAGNCQKAVLLFRELTNRRMKKHLWLLIALMGLPLAAMA
jgi:hypothetical protein